VVIKFSGELYRAFVADAREIAGGEADLGGFGEKGGGAGGERGLKTRATGLSGVLVVEMY
jgi:hypothetical protein